MDSYNPGKRSRDEYEDHQGGQQQQHAQENGHYEEQERESKKQHVDPMQELINNVCKDIRRLGENPNIANQVDDVSYISNPIVAEFEKIDQLRTNILTTVYAIVVEQPQKINSLSNLILICNAKNFVVAKYVVEYLHARTQELLDSTSKSNTVKSLEDAGPFNNIKSILKFFAALNPIIENNAVTNVFKQFLNLAIDLQNETPDKRNGLAQAIYYNVLISLPYLLSNVSDNTEEIIEQMNELVELAKDFKVVENHTNLLLQPYDSKLDNYKLPYQPEKIIDLVLPALIDLQSENKDWANLKNKLFVNYSELVQPIIDEALVKNPISKELVKHKLPQFSLPEVSSFSTYKPQGLIDQLWAQNSRVLFQVYNTTEFDTVPFISTYFGLFFKDLCFDILTNLSFNKTEASIQLSILDLYFSRDLFAPPGSSIDELTLINNDNVANVNDPKLSTWKVEDIAIESILTMIFQLPSTLHYEIYYYTVLISCCRESPESIAPVFGRAIRFFYNNLETLDYELKIRFLDWMTIQISNFEFSWKWDEWVADSVKYRNLKHHPKKNFIKNLISKEVRLSNKNRIKESFVTLDQDNNNEIKTLDEFYKYLNISIFENTTEFIVNYDTELYGGKEEYKQIIEQTYEEKLATLSQKSVVSSQEEIFFVFLNSSLPLHEVSNKVYDFVISHWKSNTEFADLYTEIVSALAENPDINGHRFLINLIFQTYAYIGSRSIYSVVSILSRDVNKLKYVSGTKIKYFDDEPHFEEVKLSKEDFEDRQKWIIDCIFRIWSHQPQVVFLILEYLIEFGILKPEFLIVKNLELSNNLIIENVSCMESTNRVLNNYYEESLKEPKPKKEAQVVVKESAKEKKIAEADETKEEKPKDDDAMEEDTEVKVQAEEETKVDEAKEGETKDEEVKEEETKVEETKAEETKDIEVKDEQSKEAEVKVVSELSNDSEEDTNAEFKRLILLLLNSIVSNLNSISRSLQVQNSDKIEIIKEFSEEEAEDTELMAKIDNECLYYEYKGLLKSYFRRYIKNNSRIEFLEEITQIINLIENEPSKADVVSWVSEI